MSAYKKNQVTAALFTVIGALLTWDAFQYSYNSSFFLRGLSLSLLFLGLGYGLSLAVRKPVPENASGKASDRSDQPEARVLPAFQVFGLVGGYLIFMFMFGFLFSTVSFAFIGQWIFTKKFRWRHVIYAACLALFVFYLFFEALGVRLPTAIWSLDPYFRIP